ncbi:hypothetical protein [Paenibacillus radicis (ex Gao et al. 2016)]|uniref:Uncharacterized protein n=1 Tax=Paenibacillus radicis (ex Gao et al. 2016) TaxID=1737354 RepID=A0A917LWI8_9BACL|nr:hypothetical protein [Paenibacillus radicis (ex Gao et al. 2016)]GGG59904.1 hypothetical protein GCM10010918_11380 [Paenibacillus radicis (ex Gao et al. 2016)]
MDQVFADGTEIMVSVASQPRDAYVKVIEQWYKSPSGFLVQATASGMYIKFTKYLTKQQKAELLQIIRDLNYSS